MGEKPKLILCILLLITLAEMLAMIIVDIVFRHSSFCLRFALIDSLLLVIIICPFLYHWIIKKKREKDKVIKELQLLASAIEQSSETVVITGSDGDIVYINPAFERTTGFTKNEVIGKNPRILKSGKHEHEYFTELWRTISNGKVWRGRLINKKKDGSLYEDDTVIAPVKDKNGNIVNYVAVRRDITEKLNMENRLRQAHKMEAMGQLAGGVAHDFNNLLTLISGYNDLLAEELPPDSPLSRFVKEIKKASDSAAELTRKLLAFSRQQVLNQKILNLNEVITETMTMLGRLIGKNIQIETSLDPSLKIILADKGQLEQILMNLTINARDAMPEGGQLFISTKNTWLNNCELKKTELNAGPGEYTELSVKDTGTGMDKQTLALIFEPFFTTKEPGKGTGLGLSTVYGIVKQNNGCIQVDSEPGKGTTFRIYLPVSATKK